MNELHERLAKAALKNAVELQQEAKLLFDNKRFPRAYALLVASGEEAIKALGEKAFAAKLISPKEFTVKRGRHDRDIMKDHETKQQFYAYLVSLVQASVYGADMKEAMRRFRRSEQNRQSAMYVDSKGREIRTPKQLITSEKCKTLLDNSETILEAFGLIVNMDNKELGGLFEEGKRLLDSAKKSSNRMTKLDRRTDGSEMTVS